jgi:hypothetical protein
MPNAFQYQVGDRSIKKTFLCSLAAMISVSANSAHPSEIDDKYIDQFMECNQEIDPAKIIREFQKRKIIGTKPVDEGDGIPTFKLLKKAKYQGLLIKYIEGWSHNRSVFFRGPGTAPPVFIGLVFDQTDADKVAGLYPKSVDTKFKGTEFYAGSKWVTDSNYSIEVGKAFKSFPTIQCDMRYR